MCAICHEAKQLIRLGAEYWRDESDVRQMSAAQVRIINGQYIAGLPVLLTYQRAHGIGHAAKMHRDMCRLSKELAIGAEQGTGEVQSVLDIWREGGAPQHQAHFIANGGDSAGKKVQFNSIHAGFPVPDGE